MNHRFLVSKEIKRLFSDTELSVSNILRTVTQEKYTGLIIKNKEKFSELSDEDWLQAIEKAIEQTEKEEKLTDEEFKNFTNTIFNNGK